jgi:hypothetical protein
MNTIELFWIFVFRGGRLGTLWLTGWNDVKIGFHVSGPR